MSKTVVIADDHPIFRQGLAQILNDAGEFHLVGEADNGLQALELLDELQPDIALVDINMPLMDGLKLVRTAMTRSLAPAFVILTMFKDDEYFREAMDLGVMGYLLKDSATSDLLECLRTVAKGRHYISPTMSELLVLRSSGIGKDAPGSLTHLSPTERRILRMIADGKTSKEIADELSISFHTVNNHRAHICEKLRLEGPNKLLQFAMEHKTIL
jgi:DNA-binding NarL/FixJ family response regulator